MKNTWFILFAIANGLTLNAQSNSKKDSLSTNSAIEIPKLHGTCALPNTAKQQNCKGYGVYFKNLNFEPCSEKEKDINNDRIHSLVLNDTCLSLGIKFRRNCCHQFLCDFEIVADSVLNLVLIGYGDGYCACNCCFRLHFDFEIIREYSEFDHLKGVMIDGDITTFRRFK